MTLNVEHVVSAFVTALWFFRMPHVQAETPNFASIYGVTEDSAVTQKPLEYFIIKGNKDLTVDLR